MDAKTQSYKDFLMYEMQRTVDRIRINDRRLGTGNYLTEIDLAYIEKTMEIYKSLK